jgi:uncharacterized protein (DUF1499 family)
MTFNETPAVARWTLRIALFAIALALVALLAHRLGPMPTLTAFNLLILSFVAAVAALLLGVVAGVVIWRQGCAGGFRVTGGMIIAAGLLGWPLAFLGAYRSLPPINDVSTDTQSPPRFVDLAKARGPGSNSPAYPMSFAKLQAEAYPDLKPLVIDRSVEETFVIARGAVADAKMTIVRELLPDDKPGVIEAVDRTLVFGLYDDVVIRVEGDATRSRIDLRSASRFGTHDLGRNADRMRRLMRGIVAKLEATIPSASGESYVKWSKKSKQLLTRRGLTADAQSKGSRKSGDPSATEARRELEQKGGPRSKDGQRSPSKQDR